MLSQTFRALIHSRLEKSLSSYANTYRDARLIVLEPSKGDADLFFFQPVQLQQPPPPCRARLPAHARAIAGARRRARKEFAHYGVKLNLHRAARSAPPSAAHSMRGTSPGQHWRWCRT